MRGMGFCGRSVTGRRCSIALAAVTAGALLSIAGAPAAVGPANDNFVNAQPLASTASGGAIAGTNVGATAETGEPLHGGVVGGHSIWYSWVAPDTGPFQFRASGIPGNNTILAAYTGTSLAGLHEVVSNDSGSPSAICLQPAAAGQTYYFAIDGGGGTTGTTSLDWRVYTGTLPCPTSTTAISGPTSPRVADTLTGTPGNWAPAGQTEDYKWYRCAGITCTAIAGATALTYQLQEADAGMRLRFLVTENGGGSSFEDASPASGVVGVAVENANGSTIAYTSNRTGTSRIFESAANGSGSANQMTGNASGPGPDAQPNWSTHGDAAQPDRILFNQGGVIAVLDASSPDTVTSLGVSGSWPWMRRTGNRLAFDDGSGISFANSDPTNLNQVSITTAAGDTHPSLSAVGTSVVFARAGDIWLASTVGAPPCNPAGSHECQLTTTGTNSEPSWSPDGLSIAYVHSGQLWTMDSDGGFQTALVAGSVAVADPAWSPDGTKILFSGTSSGNADIYAVGRNGTGQTDLTPNTPTSNETQPTWQPQATVPAATFPPTIAGAAAVGSTLSGSDGTYFNGTLPTTITNREWVRCNSAGANCTSTGTTGTAYVVVAADVGSTIRYRQTVQNAAGSSTVDSASTAVVGGGSMPNLGVVIAGVSSVDVGQGDGITIFVTNTGGAGSLQTNLEIQLPPGLTLSSSPSYEIGSGCTGTTTIDCFLDYLASGVTTKVSFAVKATAAGAQSLTASVTSDRDSDLTNNQGTLTIQVSPVSTPSPPPIQVGPVSTPSPAPIQVGPVSTPTPQAPPAPKPTQHKGKTFRGTSAPNRLTGTPYGDVLRGFGGNDRLFGLGGNDVIRGGNGNDILVGGAGKDLLFGGPGADVIQARDGQRDVVSCGTGRDTAVVDRIDLVSHDCERVRRG